MPARLCLFFFFKQKTAYEMRISDWSSDVCSSDLAMTRAEEILIVAGVTKKTDRSVPETSWHTAAEAVLADMGCDWEEAGPHWGRRRVHRSEEHTSELQSLMRISYAVFCLKKKKRKTARYMTKTYDTHNAQTRPKSTTHTYTEATTLRAESDIQHR